MGQASIRAQANKRNQDALNRVNIDHIAAAVRKLCQAASGNFGVDCYLHAALGQALLRTEGVEAEIAGGEASWRVGEGDGDVITHAKQPGMVPQEGAYPYHAWIEVAGRILDLTTYQMHEKAEHLDSLDGGNTTVDWCPDYLFINKSEVQSFKDVAQKHTGMFHYRRDVVIEASLKRAAKPLEDEDLQSALMLYNSPDMVAIGPNHFKSVG